ncbi:hypothetical protein [Bradyrhizobium lablabi]|uniref:hypothetical protein n=1 Tax=Bradyrhizobium lablabi TaxID=722472 RepID=UPI001BAD80AE|nr:hypothetical protein [Bradyrhizobium lablabi]MBR0693964.1 hypothetical protein [Bradyrhizobium lablabi]
MNWRKLGSSLAIARRRRVVATALLYGLSLTVRFTSAAGEEIEAPAPAARGANPMMSIMINDGAQILHKDWLTSAFHRGWLGSRGCRAECEGAVPMPFTPGCASHP